MPLRSGEAPGPRLLCAGQPVTTPGRPLPLLGRRGCGHGAATRVIERQVAQGVDLIKVMATGGMFTQRQRPRRRPVRPGDPDRGQSPAAAHGLGVAAHCHGTRGIELAAGPACAPSNTARGWVPAVGPATMKTRWRGCMLSAACGFHPRSIAAGSAISTVPTPPSCSACAPPFRPWRRSVFASSPHHGCRHSRGVPPSSAGGAGGVPRA
jgi:hypothetical protein